MASADTEQSGRSKIIAVLLGTGLFLVVVPGLLFCVARFEKIRPRPAMEVGGNSAGLDRHSVGLGHCDLVS